MVVEAMQAPITVCDPSAANVIGTAGDDELTGTQGNDVILGGAGADVIDGLAGDDTICGDAGNDDIFGGSGEDIIQGGPGADRLRGGAGQVDMVGYTDALGSVTVSLANGSASGRGNDTIGSAEAIVGSAFRDTLTGNGGTNLIIGWSRADHVDGRGGIDFVGLLAAGEVDLAAGSSSGADGADRIRRVEGAIGSSGNDALRGDGHRNLFVGGPGNDLIVGRGGGDEIQGNGGADHLRGDGGSDRMDGGNGRDSINGGGGIYDVVSFADAGQPVTVDLAAESASGAGEDRIVDVDAVIGSRFSDALYGSAGSDSLHGEAGGDLLVGRGGSDWLNGSEGNDLLRAGAGKDLLDGGEGADDGAGGRGQDGCFAVETKISCEINPPTPAGDPPPLSSGNTSAPLTAAIADPGGPVGSVTWLPAPCAADPYWKLHTIVPRHVTPTIGIGQQIYWQPFVWWFGANNTSGFEYGAWVPASIVWNSQTRSWFTDLTIGQQQVFNMQPNRIYLYFQQIWWDNSWAGQADGLLTNWTLVSTPARFGWYTQPYCQTF
jgi:hypothetical protein